MGIWIKTETADGKIKKFEVRCVNCGELVIAYGRDRLDFTDLVKSLVYITKMTADLFKEHQCAGSATSTLSFSEALKAVKAGGRIQRSGWNGNGMWVELHIPEGDSKMTRSYLYMSCADGGLVPWVASQTDILANDWTVIE